MTSVRGGEGGGVVAVRGRGLLCRFAVGVCVGANSAKNAYSGVGVQASVCAMCVSVCVFVCHVCVCVYWVFVDADSARISLYFFARIFLFCFAAVRV